MVDAQSNDRIKAAIGAAALQALLVYGLFAGLGMTVPEVREQALAVFRIPPEPPPPEKIVPPPVRSTRPEGEASPPNIRSKATELVAPPRVVELPVPPVIVAAPKADLGRDASSGAADVPGPGTGAGGEGDGRGGGGYGDGDGGGGRHMPPRWRKGRIRDSDYPAAAREAMAGGTVSVLYTIAPSGRVTQCEVTRSSGNPVLDETTCRLIMERFRYDPSRDARGRPIQSRMMSNHSWIVDESEASAGWDER